VKIHNVRVGFATNSSSSHSIVMIPQGQRERTDEYERYSYNWEQFTLADADSKTAYFLTQMYSALANTNLSHDEIVHVMQGVLGDHVDLSNFPCEVDVDHQSQWHGMADSMKHTPDLVRAMWSFVQRDDVVILGGNDNSDGQTPPNNSWQDDRTAMFGQFGDKRVRQDGEHWVLFNKTSGTKLRMSFDAQSAPYVKSTVPELVDLKVTNYCAYGCTFCLVPGTQILTPSGIKAIEHIREHDQVITFNLDTHQMEATPVAATYARDYQGDLVEILVDNGERLHITPEHEVFVLFKGWMPAHECVVGDRLFDAHTLNAVQIVSVNHMHYEGKVYNFGTPPNHNYWANGMLVHNCYQSSTKAGVHADLDHIKSILKALGEQQVFEVAIGGGEPTHYPHLAEVLTYAAEQQIVPNFTTYGVDWLQNAELMNVVRAHVGAIGVSVHGVKDLNKVSKINQALNVNTHRWDDNYVHVTAQHVVGSVDLDETAQILERAWDEGWDLLLLGYKNVGFGATQAPHDLTGLDTLLKLRQQKRAHYGARVSMLGVDTAFVQQFDPILNALGISPVLKTSEEGKFSMYVDAVTLTQGPSSYMPDQMVPLDITNCDASMRSAYVKW
jgi:molybdenum cofactor biosynthesis enzyme MoaA